MPPRATLVTLPFAFLKATLSLISSILMYPLKLLYSLLPATVQANISHMAEILYFLVDPWLFMLMALSFVPGTVTSLVRERKWDVLLSLQRFREACFTRFWAWASAGMSEMGRRRIRPLFEGKVKDGLVVEGRAEDEIAKRAMSGVVIEVGPGPGIWMPLFAEAYNAGHGENDAVDQVNGNGENGEARRRMRGGRGSGQEPRRPRIARVYGVEPSESAHAELRAQVARHGLEGVYEVVPLGIEELNVSSDKWNHPPLEKGSVDCIVTILCLCSIPDPERNIRELYSYLKPGGRWFVYEHQRCGLHRVWWLRWYQGQFSGSFRSFVGSDQQISLTLLSPVQPSSTSSGRKSSTAVHCDVRPRSGSARSVRGATSTSSSRRTSHGTTWCRTFTGPLSNNLEYCDVETSSANRATLRGHASTMSTRDLLGVCSPDTSSSLSFAGQQGWKSRLERYELVR